MKIIGNGVHRKSEVILGLRFSAEFSTVKKGCFLINLIAVISQLIQSKNNIFTANNSTQKHSTKITSDCLSTR